MAAFALTPSGFLSIPASAELNMGAAELLAKVNYRFDNSMWN